MAKKRNDYRIKERLTHSFLIASAIPAAVSVVVLAVLIIVAVIYAGVLKNYGFAQGDVGKTMTYFRRPGLLCGGASGTTIWMLWAACTMPTRSMWRCLPGVLRIWRNS